MGGYRATIVTYGFQRNNIQITRKYDYFTQGLTVWTWRIDKKTQYVNLSFFVKRKDYEKVVNNSPTYHNLWFSDIKKIDAIPFFGLRNISQSPNKILLFFDLLKYNYSIIIGFFILFAPILIVIIEKNEDFKL